MLVPRNVHPIRKNMAHNFESPGMRLSDGADRHAAQRGMPPLESDAVDAAIMSAAPDCVVLIDQDERIVEFNRTAETTFGHAGSGVTGRRLSSVIMPAAWRARYASYAARVLATGDSPLLNRRIELDALRADGTAFAIELTLAPVRIDGRLLYAAFIRDISQQRRDRSALEESARHYRLLLDLSPEAILVLRGDEFILANQAAARLLGVASPEHLAGRSVYSFIQARDRERFAASADELLEQGGQAAFGEQLWLRLDGQPFHAEVAATRIAHDDGPLVQLAVRDITSRKRIEAFHAGRSRLLGMVADGTPLQHILAETARFASLLSDRFHAAIMRADHAAGTLTCVSAPDLPASYFGELGPVAIGRSQASCGTAAARREPVLVADISQDPLWRMHSATALAHGLQACSSWPILGRDGSVLGTFAMYADHVAHPSDYDTMLGIACSDVAALAIETRAAEERMRRQASHDALTGLPNRVLFHDCLASAVNAAQRHGKRFALLFVDLDRFKEVNDSCGHDAGDTVLREMARRMRACLRQSDHIARMGGDEFYVLIEDVRGRRDAIEVAEKLLAAARVPVEVAGVEHRLSASIGIAMFPEHGVSGEALLQLADQAMYSSKRDGRDGYRFVAPAVARPACTVVALHGRRDGQ